jgi:hypothetical protein
MDARGVGSCADGEQRCACKELAWEWLLLERSISPNRGM